MYIEYNVFIQAIVNERSVVLEFLANSITMSILVYPGCMCTRTYLDVHLGVDQWCLRPALPQSLVTLGSFLRSLLRPSREERIQGSDSGGANGEHPSSWSLLGETHQNKVISECDKRTS